MCEDTYCSDWRLGLRMTFLGFVVSSMSVNVTMSEEVADTPQIQRPWHRRFHDDFYVLHMVNKGTGANDISTHILVLAVHLLVAVLAGLCFLRIQLWRVQSWRSIESWCRFLLSICLRFELRNYIVAGCGACRCGTGTASASAILLCELHSRWWGCRY